MAQLTAKTALGMGKIIESGQVTEEMGQDFIAKAGNPILTLVEDGVTLGPTCGYETIARATNVFASGIYCYDCTTEDIDVADQLATEPRPGLVYAMDPERCSTATFKDIFTTFGDPGRVVMPQGEIVRFCKETPEKLRQNGYVTFFLFQVQGEEKVERFVASVSVGSGGLGVGVGRFGFGNRWHASRRLQVVTPQL